MVGLSHFIHVFFFTLDGHHCKNVSLKHNLHFAFKGHKKQYYADSFQKLESRRLQDRYIF